MSDVYEGKGMIRSKVANRKGLISQSDMGKSE